MGLCISKWSADHHKYRVNDHDDCQEIVLFDDGDNPIDGISSSSGSSLCSREGSKGVNQDAAVIYKVYGGKEDVTFCGVFDGHGTNGHLVSKFVRNYLMNFLLDQKIIALKNKRSSKKACISAFKVIDEKIRHFENMDCSLSGTTAVIVLRQGDNLMIANLGDSRAVLGVMNYDGEITAVQLTTDLKPSVTTERKRIKRRNGRVLALLHEPHIERVWLPQQNIPGLAMTRSFGDFLVKNHGIISIPEVSFHHLTSKDQFLIIATDGVWDVLNNDEVATIVASTDTKVTAAEALVNAAVSKWGEKHPSSNRDDCTALILSLHTNLATKTNVSSS
ncbi:probable protein phosphatase 2C 72 [Impatiens glandulifera]|uniref:probable protein phosphatase 2C 72 n=1 Tax=Impatiens glandulifera TaxID=253017 RepID=UPI001FB09A7D|nr:probable protein phosphatase 2C 72 [Impatiens glandulifera]